MRIAIVSDVHGNYEALKAVFEDISNSEIDAVFCLGDLVGYGPEPDKVVTFIREKNIPCVIGNHEVALWDDAEFDTMNDDAKHAIVLTKKMLSEENMEYLKSLPRFLIKDDLLFVHGCPPDSFTKYINDVEDFNALFESIELDIVFVGHTHDLKIYIYEQGEVAQKNLIKGVRKLKDECKYIINVGSVGQPRDGNNNAKYVIFDDKDCSLDVRFVEYNIKKTADLIKELGFPVFDAKRLF